jgi:hypothetical protein
LPKKFPLKERTKKEILALPNIKLQPADPILNNVLESYCPSLINLIVPFYPKSGSKDGRSPYPLATMRRYAEINRISERVHCRCLPVIRAWPAVAFDRLETRWKGQGLLPKGSIGIDSSGLLRATPGSRIVAAI